MLNKSIATLKVRCTVLLVLLLGAPGVFAQAFFDVERGFVVDRSCDAHTSIRKETGPVALESGQTYTALGENKRPGGTHAFIVVGDQRKWVALGCGHYEGGAPIETECLPFFDDVDNPVSVNNGTADITPPAPTVTPFGKALLAVCGEPSTSVTRDAFKGLMRAHPEVLDRIMRFTGGRVFADRPVRSDVEAYLEDLTDAWFAIHGFDHIFCGEPQPGGSVGGLHYHGRYLELQANETACRLPPNHKNEVVPDVIYTMGVRVTVDGRSAQSPVKGYGLTLSAEDILKVVTRALAENPTLSTSSVGCLLDVTDDEHQFTTVFVRRRSGVRTFYPDATPDPQRNGPCSAPIVLVAEAGNQPPHVAEALRDLEVSADTLLEWLIPDETFIDPDEDTLAITVSTAEGGILPPWIDFDSETRTLLMLPETEQVGTVLELAVRASDGSASVSESMTVTVTPSVAGPFVVDVDASVADGESLRLIGGIYNVAPIGTDDGGRFDAWHAGAEQWQHAFAIRLPEVVVAELPNGLHASARDALASAPSRLVFALDAGAEVVFSVPPEAEPVAGGVSLRVTRIAD